MGDFSTEKLFLFVLFALPGAVAIRVYSLWCPIQQKDWKESVFDAVLYSTVGLGVWMLLAPEVVKRFVAEVVSGDGPAFNSRAVEAALSNRWYLVLFVFVTPAALSWAWYYLRFRLLHNWFGIDHPTRTAWDWAFDRKEPVYIFFYLKSKHADGRQVILVGYFNGRSFVSSYPLDPEIFVERVHVLNPDGSVGEPITGSDGMIVKYSECERLEFLSDPASVQTPVQNRVWRWAGSCRRWAGRQVTVLTQRARQWRTRAVEPGATPAGGAETASAPSSSESEAPSPKAQ